MIVVGGEGALVVMLLMLLLFFGLPLLLLRGLFRGRGTVHVLGPGGWASREWSEPAPRQWEPPREPVLPPVRAPDVTSLRDRLGHDVRSLDAGEDPVARQALADAAERLATSGTLLERATSDAMVRTAWLAAVEGLAAARVARERLGLDPGPPLPALPGSGEQLRERARVEVDGRTHEGSPTYEPGHPHWFPGGEHGGRHVPGGWYAAPFWPSTLLLGGLGGWALGGLLSGLMYSDDLDDRDW